jgi:hypothetical protein
MEGVQCHLRGGFTDGLPSDNADCLTRFNQRPEVFDVKHPLEIPSQNVSSIGLLLLDQAFRVRVEIL